MLTLTDWAKLVTDEKGKLRVEATLAALSDLRAWPLLRMLPFKPVMGGAYIGNFATSTTQAATRAMNAAFSDSAPGVEQFAFLLRAAGGELKLDVNQVAGDNTGMLRAGLLTQKVKDVGARLNRMWFKGDKDAVSGAEWHGVNEFCADLTLQTAAGGNGAVVTAAMMDDLLAKVPGANVILCNRTLAIQLDALGVGVTKTVMLNQGGLTPNMFIKNYKGVPIIEVLTAPNDGTGAQEEILPFTETQGSSNVCSRITAARIGLDGLYGVQHSIFTVAPPRTVGAFEITDMNWFMSAVATDTKDAVHQLIGVKAS